MRLWRPYKFASPSSVVKQFWGVRFTLATLGLWLGDLIWLKAGQLQVLVATDVAARGLHVKHLLGNPGEIVHCAGLSEDPQRVKVVKMYEKYTLKNGEGPWYVHKRSSKNWMVFQSLLFVEGPLFYSCMFLCLGLRNGINDGLPEKRIRQQCLVSMVMYSSNCGRLGWGWLLQSFLQKSVLQWTPRSEQIPLGITVSFNFLGLSWSFECLRF